MLICQFCKKYFKNPGGHKKHENSCKNNPDRIKYPGRKFGIPAWNKGLSSKTDERVKKNSLKVKKSLQKKVENGTFVPSVMSEEARKRQSLRMSQQNPGGKSKWYVVNNIKVQGSWEYNIALKLNELNIEWQRCKPISYIMENKERSYTPDFFLPQFDVYLEIKGYWWGNDKEKMNLVINQNPSLNIKIIEEKEYNKILGGELVW